MTDSALSDAPTADSVFDRARSLLRSPPTARANLWATLAASALAALAAVLMAGAVILGPGFEVEAPASVVATP